MPLLPFTIVFMLGILMQGCGVGAFLMLFPLAGAVACLMLKKPYGVLMCCGLLAGFALSLARSPGPLSDSFVGESVMCSGVAVEVRAYEPAQVIVARVDSCRGEEAGPFMVKLTVPSSIPEVGECDRIVFSTILSPLVADPDLPDEIDYDAPLRRMGVRGQGFVRPDSLRVLYPEPGLLNDIRRLRHDVTLAIVGLPLSDSAKEFLNAVLTGDRSMLTADMRELFSTTGLSHLLALSGLHVAIIAWIVSMILFPLYAGGAGHLRTVLLVLALWMFAVMTGLSPLVVRSVVMATIFLVACVLQRTHAPFNSLCAAALVILFFTPHALYAVSFQLSFLAVASILLFAEKLNPFPQRRRFLHGLAAYPAVTLAAMLGTAFASAFYFNVFPLLFIPANFVGALLMPPILVCGVVMLAAGFMGLTLPPLAWLTDRMVDALTSTAGLLGSMPAAAVSDVYISPVSLVAWFLSLIPLALWFYRRRYVYAVAATLCLCFTAATVVMAGDRERGAAETYIPRSKSSTSLIVTDGPVMRVFTTMPEHRHAEIADECMRKYRRYMLRRGMDSIVVRTTGRRYAESIDVAGRRFVLMADGFDFRSADLEGNRALTGSGCESRGGYLIVCNGFRGDICQAVSALSPDTVLLSSDLNPRLHDRYMRELTEGRVAVRSIKNSPFSLRTESR